MAENLFTHSGRGGGDLVSVDVAGGQVFLTLRGQPLDVAAPGKTVRQPMPKAELRQMTRALVAVVARMDRAAAIAAAEPV